jgi:hypothetical protein
LAELKFIHSILSKSLIHDKILDKVVKKSEMGDLVAKAVVALKKDGFEVVDRIQGVGEEDDEFA